VKNANSAGHIIDNCVMCSTNVLLKASRTKSVQRREVETCNALLHVLLLCVEVGEACQPTRVQVQGICPRVQHSFTVEIGRAIGYSRELQADEVGVNKTATQLHQQDNY
jgi:hypothetical protein